MCSQQYRWEFDTPIVSNPRRCLCGSLETANYVAWVRASTLDQVEFCDKTLYYHNLVLFPYTYTLPLSFSYYIK